MEPANGTFRTLVALAEGTNIYCRYAESGSRYAYFGNEAGSS